MCGIQRIVMEGRDCEGLITQLAAVRSALEGVGGQVIMPLGGDNPGPPTGSRIENKHPTYNHDGCHEWMQSDIMAIGLHKGRGCLQSRNESSRKTGQSAF